MIGGCTTARESEIIPCKFPLGQIFDKGIKFTFGQVPVHKYIDHLIE